MVELPHEREGFWEQVVRKITNKGTMKCIGKVPSLKNDRNIWYESTIERDFIYLLEFDWDVVRYKEQPFRLKYIYESKTCIYVPDFFVQRRSIFQVIETKPEEKANKEENKFRYRIIGSILGGMGYQFVVATDAKIRIQPRLENTKIFWRYSRTRIHPLQRVKCNEYLSEAREASIQDLADALAPHGVTLQVVYALLFWGILSTDMSRPVNPDALVRFSSTGTPAYSMTADGEV